ncbi:MAG: rhodanese-like domain-containing protein [Saprospiraceae bacterium]|nr:rhodanese-like domain-containing protein [Saprospiraceae bacterium]
MDIDVKELQQRLANNDEIVLIDVREPHEHQEFNIGGKLIPLGNIPSVVEDLEEHMEDEIVLYCRSGNRSGMAQHFLQQLGFTKVRNLEGGVLAWIDAFGT